jgi:C-terminal of Roc, COR, domain/Ras of Complex, Roc, domain of DAPkinase/Leucine rich repeat
VLFCSQIKQYSKSNHVSRSPFHLKRQIELIYKNQNKELAMLGNDSYREAQQRIENARQNRARILILSDIKLRELPDEISSLNQLKWLNLSNNQLRELPEAIASLTQLQGLELSNNQLTKLPEAIPSLTKLRVLNLSNNQLRELPEALGSLSLLRDLNLDKNPLNPDLAAAYQQGTEALWQYLRAKAEAQITLNEAKLILIGEGEVGKSCLLGALREDEWLENRLTTHGIEIKPVIVTHPETDTEISLNGWDFGGQPVYRSTHQLFFSAPAVYLVVWKPREGPQQGFVKEWITLIKHREPDAKILVVATHGGPGQRQPDIDRQEICDRFNSDSDTVLGFFHVNSKPDTQNSCTGLAKLKRAIANVAASLPEMGRSVPAKWQRVREILQTNDKAYLPYNDVLAICTQHGIDNEQAELFLRISHTLGHIIHYHYDSILRDIVILKPNWLAKAIGFVLDDATTRRRNGLVEFEHLSELWSNPPFPGETGYPKQLHPIFLKLMERFDLSYRVVLDPTEPSNTSLIAQLVPDTRPELPNWGQQPEAGDRQQVQICRIVDDRGQLAVAEGLFYQLIVRLHKYSLGRCNYEKSIHWQRGLMLDDDYNGRALLEYIDSDVKITVRAAYPERFLSYLTAEIKWLVENFWEGLRCNVMVPCIAPCGKNLPGNALFEVEKLIESKKKNRHDYPCPISGCGEWQNIDRLLNNAPIASPPSQEIIEQFQNVRDDLNNVLREIGTLDIRAEERFQSLSQEQRVILSKGDEQFASLMQMSIDQAKDGPRLFSFKPIEPRFFDSPKWIKTKFQITLWCEHSRRPLPALNPHDKKKGVYELEVSREWFTKAAPYLKILTGTLSLVLPVANSATKLILDEATYKGIEEGLDLGQKSIESTLKASDLATNLSDESDIPDWQQDEAPIMAKDSVLRKLHDLLKAKDPGFGGLVRVQNRRREFVWVHEQFVDEY